MLVPGNLRTSLSCRRLKCSRMIQVRISTAGVCVANSRRQEEERDKARTTRRLQGAASFVQQIVSAADMFGQFEQEPHTRSRCEEQRKDGAHVETSEKKWKWIRFQTQSTITRDLADAVGSARSVAQYLSLPVEEYALLDPSLIRRRDDGAFHLAVPLGEVLGGMGLASGGNKQGLLIVPQMLIRPTVNAAQQEVILNGSEAGLGVKDLDKHFELEVRSVLRWSKVKKTGVSELASGMDHPIPGDDCANTNQDIHERAKELNEQAENPTPRMVNSGDAWELSCQVKLEARLEIPSPYSMIPSPVTGSLIKLIAKSVLLALLPAFLELLIRDYARWAHKDDGREKGEAVGSLTSHVTVMRDHAESETGGPLYVGNVRNKEEDSECIK